MWIGWDDQSDPVKIAFQFDTLRKFHEVSIHVNNFVSQGAQVFASVDLYFSMDGQKFSEFPLRWTPKGNLKNETAHLEQIPLKGRLATYVRMEFYHSNHWLLLSEIFFRSDIFTGNVTDEIHSLNYLQDGPVDKSMGKTKSDDVLAGSTSTTSTGAMIGLIAGSLSVLVLLSVVMVVCYVMRRNHRNTKLVGVMGMTPKSMSMGLGCNDSNPQKHSSSSGTTKKVGKIALCDLKPVSISGETDSDESLYHELVFGLGGSASKSEGSSGSSSNQTARKNTNRKIKYQRVNHGGDFSDFMGMRNLHDEISYFSHSASSTPATIQKQNMSHHISHPVPQHGNILPPTLYQHHHPIDQQHLHHPMLTLQPKTTSLVNGNCSLLPPSNTSVFTTSTSKSSSGIPAAAAAAATLGYFNSPHGRRTPSTMKNSESNYYAATDIFHVSDKHFDRF
ncbi:unnamed protein product [Allacma fusca]|uniref:F5/8 type C domain-containing protein n=1 Tax=Allacma fusca TaxID=39272 RepID=A0A8J2P0Q8_9HEXA|nr:unnamed protein product [Allacma fusca]